MLSYSQIHKELGHRADDLLKFSSHTFDPKHLTFPSAEHIDVSFAHTDRNNQVLRSLSQLYNNGNLSGTGYFSILPVDQGIEHSAGASFAKNPLYFDPEHIVKLALAAGCNGVVSTLGGLGLVSRKYAHKIPFIVKMNHNELLTYPNKFDQVMFGQVEQAWNMGASGIGATIYF